MNKCPNCGKSYYTGGETISTLVYYQPIYKDGININPDKNSIIMKLHCLECNTNWQQQVNPNREDYLTTTIIN